MKIAILGLSITSSWGNGHATTFRSLVKGLFKRGHTVLFLERDVPWYASNRDMPVSDFCRIILYNSLEQLKGSELHDEILGADVVIVGSYVPDGVELGRWVIRNARGIKVFYDIDTPVTLAKLKSNSCSYLIPGLVPSYNIYLSFSAGKSLEILENDYGSPAARQFYCSVDTDFYYQSEAVVKWDLGYLGTYSDDRQPVLNALMIKAAENWKEGKFVVAGPQYPQSVVWPQNVQRIEHMPPARHIEFYNSQKFTLNVTRSDMVRMGYSPSVRLFEAAACGVPIISDWWEGLETIFSPGEDIFISRSAGETIEILKNITEQQRIRTGKSAMQTVLRQHTGLQRAIELENYISEAALRISRKEQVQTG